MTIILFEYPISMQHTLFVIDDFLDLAPKLRQEGILATYPTPKQQTYFPGKNANRTIIIDGLDALISNLVSQKLTPSLTNSHAKFRLALVGDKGKGGVHIDNCQWSGILYLSRNEDCVGGTNFYKHKDLNSDVAPLTKTDLHLMGLASFESFWNDVLLKDSNNMDKWELTTHIPMKFNRLILFRPWLFHDAGPSFGNTPENGRLIYPLFYDAVQT